MPSGSGGTRVQQHITEGRGTSTVMPGFPQRTLCGDQEFWAAPPTTVPPSRPHLPLPLMSKYHRPHSAEYTPSSLEMGGRVPLRSCQVTHSRW